MDVSKKIDGVRYSLNQDRHNQVTIKKEKEIVSIQNFNYALSIGEAFDILNKVSSGKYSVVELKGNKEKLNTEKEIIVPKANPCLFCGGIPKVIDLKPAENNGAARRTLQCTGPNCVTSITKSEKTGEIRITYKRWTYAVDVVDSVEKADAKFITEWNRRMPQKGTK